MSTASPKDSNLSFKQSCEDLARFIGDFSNLMATHLEVVAKTLSASAACVTTDVLTIQSKGRAGIERGDSFHIKNPHTELFHCVRISKSDPLFADPVGLARPISDSMALHLSKMKVLEASLDRFLSSLEVVKSVDEISMQRLNKEIKALRALSHGMQEVLAQYRLYGSISNEFVERIKADLLAALEVNVSEKNKARIFRDFLGR